jgi:hypothetical protein
VVLEPLTKVLLVVTLDLTQALLLLVVVEEVQVKSEELHLLQTQMLLVVMVSQ